MYDRPFSDFVVGVQAMIDQKGWTGVTGQQNLFEALFHNGYQYDLIPDLQPTQFGWQVDLSSLTVGMGDRGLLSPTETLGLIPGNVNIHGFTGFIEDYNHRLDYIFIVDDAVRSGGTYVVAIVLSPLTPK